jgi:hypothetical protein
MNLNLFKLKAANEPVWLVQGVNALVGAAAAIAGGGKPADFIPSLLVALSAPLLRSRVTPVRVVADLVNVALHTPAPGGGSQPIAVQTVQDAKAVVEDAKAAAVAAGLVTVSKPSAPAVLPPVQS